MITLYELKYQKRDFAHAPEELCVLYFMLCEVANELNTLSKQAMFWMRDIDAGTKAQEYARMSASLMNLKLLAGRGYEAWNILRKEQHSKVYRSLAAELDTDSINALNSVKNYFKQKDNIIDKLRNKTAFHHDFDLARIAYLAFPDSEPLNEFVSEHVGNTFYNGAHLMGAFALKQLVPGTHTLDQALLKVLDEVLGLSHWIVRYASGFAEAFSAKYILPLHAFSQPRRLDLPNAIPLSKISIPYFFEKDE